MTEIEEKIEKWRMTAMPIECFCGTNEFEDALSYGPMHPYYYFRPVTGYKDTKIVIRPDLWNETGTFADILAQMIDLCIANRSMSLRDKLLGELYEMSLCKEFRDNHIIGYLKALNLNTEPNGGGWCIFDMDRAYDKLISHDILSEENVYSILPAWYEGDKPIISNMDPVMRVVVMNKKVYTGSLMSFGGFTCDLYKEICCLLCTRKDNTLDYNMYLEMHGQIDKYCQGIRVTALRQVNESIDYLKRLGHWSEE